MKRDDSATGMFIQLDLVANPVIANINSNIHIMVPGDKEPAVRGEQVNMDGSVK